MLIDLRRNRSTPVLACMLFSSACVMAAGPAVPATLLAPRPAFATQAATQQEVHELIACRDLEVAERRIAEVLDAERSAWALSAQAKVLVLLGEAGEAIRLADEALGLDAGLQEALATKARALGLRGETESAAEWSARALSVDEEDRWSLNTHALVLYISGEVEASLALYERILSEDPDNLTALEGASVVYFNDGEGDHRQALACLDRAAELAALPAHYRWSQAQFHRILRDNAAYLASLERAIESSPNDPDYREEHTSALFTLRRFDEMDASIDAALRVVGDAAPFLCLRGQALELQGDIRGALRVYAQAAEANPDDDYPHQRMAYVYRDHLKDYEACLDAWGRAIARSDAPADLIYRRGHAHSTFGRQREACDDFTAALELDETHVLAWASLAERIDVRESIPIYMHLCELDAENSEWPGRIGFIYDRAGDRPRAIEWYTRCLELDPSRPHARRNRGLAYKQAGLLDEAIADQTYQIEHCEDRGLVGRAHFDRGNAYAAAGEYALAESDMKTALRLGVRMPATYYNLGQSYRHREMWEEGARAYSDAIALFPEYAAALGGRAMCYDALGLYERGLEDIEASMALQRRPAAYEYAVHAALLHQLGRHNAALDSARQALRMDRTKTSAWSTQLTALLALGRDDEAAAVAEDWLEALDSAATRVYLVREYWEAGRDEQAQAWIQVLIEQAPDYSHWSATLYPLSVGRFDDAARYAQRFLDAEPDHVDAYLYSALVAMELGDPDEADGLILQGLGVEAQPEQPGHAVLAVMAGLADPRESVDALEPLNRRAEAAMFVGYWLYLTGEEQAGLELLREAAGTTDGSPGSGVFARRLLQRLDGE